MGQKGEKPLFFGVPDSILDHFLERFRLGASVFFKMNGPEKDPLKSAKNGPKTGFLPVFEHFCSSAKVDKSDKKRSKNGVLKKMAKNGQKVRFLVGPPEPEIFSRKIGLFERFQKSINFWSKKLERV